MAGRMSAIVIIHQRRIQKMIKFHRFIIFTVSMLALLTGCTSQPTPAGSWACRNENTEISCGGKTCTVSLPGDFTPMSLSADTQGNLSLCAYSGCWEGKASTVTIADDYFTASGTELIWSGTTGGATSGAGRMSVTIDMNTGTATLLAENYAHPMICVAN